MCTAWIAIWKEKICCSYDHDRVETHVHRPRQHFCRSFPDNSRSKSGQTETTMNIRAPRANSSPRIAVAGLCGFPGPCFALASGPCFNYGLIVHVAGPPGHTWRAIYNCTTTLAARTLPQGLATETRKQRAPTRPNVGASPANAPAPPSVEHRPPRTILECAQCERRRPSPQSPLSPRVRARPAKVALPLARATGTARCRVRDSV